MSARSAAGVFVTIMFAEAGDENRISRSGRIGSEISSRLLWYEVKNEGEGMNQCESFESLSSLF